MSGPIEIAARADVAELGELVGVEASLAESAYALARELDSGKSGLATAAVARELRATLTAIVAGRDEEPDSDLADLGTPA
jgi:hypothetical protein